MLRTAALGFALGVFSGVAAHPDRFWGRFYDRVDGRNQWSGSAYAADAGADSPDVLFATETSDLGDECGCNNTLEADTGQSVTFTRTGAAWCRKASDGLWVQCASNNQPRVSAWLPGETHKGLAVERASTNLVQHSGDLTQASVWAVSGITAAQTSVSPSGAANSATHLTSAGAASAIWQTVTGSSAQRAGSVFLKVTAGTLDANDVRLTVSGGGGWFDVSTELDENYDTWIRFVPQECGDDSACVQKTGLLDTETDPVIGIEINDASVELDVWNWQLEAIPYSTSVIVTAGAAATRNAERAYITLTGWNETKWSSYAEIATWATSAIGSSYAYSFLGADNELCEFRTFGTVQEYDVQCDFGASSMSKTSAGTGAINNFRRIGHRYDGTTLSVCMINDCNTSTTGSQSGVDPTALDIGATALFATARANGVVRDVCLAKSATACVFDLQVAP